MARPNPLEHEGKAPEKFIVCDFTPEGHATPLFGVVADYGWCERILFSNAYEQEARDVARCLGVYLGVPVEDR
jgi:hypothetical protein